MMWCLKCRLGPDAVADLRAASNSKPEVLDWSIQVGPQGGILHALLMYQGVLFQGALPNQLPSVTIHCTTNHSILEHANESFFVRVLAVTATVRRSSSWHAVVSEVHKAGCGRLQGFKSSVKAPMPIQGSTAPSNPLGAESSAPAGQKLAGGSPLHIHDAFRHNVSSCTPAGSICAIYTPLLEDVGWGWQSLSGLVVVQWDLDLGAGVAYVAIIATQVATT